MAINGLIISRPRLVLFGIICEKLRVPLKSGNLIQGANPGTLNLASNFTKRHQLQIRLFYRSSRNERFRLSSPMERARLHSNKSSNLRQTEKIASSNPARQKTIWTVITLYRLIWHQTDLRLMSNLAEKCNHNNPNWTYSTELFCKPFFGHNR